MTGPPLSVSMDFIATGLVDMIAGLAQAVVLFGFAFWAPPVLAVAWLSTHWLLRESAIWKDRNTDEVRLAQRNAEYAYRLAVDPPAAKELRIFGLPDWVLDRFITTRRHLHQLQYQATRMRERSVIGCMLIVLAANMGVFWALGTAALGHRIGLGALIVFAQAAVGTSMIAFGGLNWALDGASAPVAAVGRLTAATASNGTVGLGLAARHRHASCADPLQERHLRLPGSAGPAGAAGLDLDIPAGSSLAIVGVNGAGKTTLAKLLCRLYDPAIRLDRGRRH